MSQFSLQSIQILFREGRTLCVCTPRWGFFSCILHVIQNRAHSDFKASFYNEKQPRVSSFLCSLLIGRLEFVHMGMGFAGSAAACFQEKSQPSTWTLSLR